MINALRHPERETVQRSTYILGRLKSIKAVKPLFGFFTQTSNIFLKIETLNTLYEIGSPEAKEFIRKVANSDVGVVKRMAQELITRRSMNNEEK